jgi:hypothetical protein
LTIESGARREASGTGRAASPKPKVQGPRSKAAEGRRTPRRWREMITRTKVPIRGSKCSGDSRKLG